MTAAELRSVTLGTSVNACSPVAATYRAPVGEVVGLELAGHFTTCESIERDGQKVPAGVPTLHLEYREKK